MRFAGPARNARAAGSDACRRAAVAVPACCTCAGAPRIAPPSGAGSQGG
jgi:hypothetical protein